MNQPSSHQPDALVMREVQAGHCDRFAQLVARYEQPLLRVARSRLGREDWAEDVVQETLLAAFKSRHTYDTQRHFRTWLWTILLNQCRQHQRRTARVPRVHNWSDRSEDAPPAVRLENAVEAGESTPLAALLEKERTAQLDRLLRQLSEAQADALRLRFFGGLKFEEIAETAGCCLATAKNRVRWGLLRLSALAGHDWHAAQSDRAQSGNARSDRAQSGSVRSGSAAQGGQLPEATQPEYWETWR